ncbi:MAG: hypothetical protein M1570_07670 [Chloroflexi bacterium]|nr:hypothetical protein [Chloroflexota bacterium]
MSRRWRSERVLVSSLLSARLMVGCTASSGFITPQQAYDIAVRDSNQGHLRAQEPPSSRTTRADLMTLESARAAFGGNGDNGGRAPTTMVWLVTLEGTWTITGGPLTPKGAGPAPQPTFHHYAVILDARTGETIAERAAD